MEKVPHASFQKHTAHAILSDLKIIHLNVLAHFKVEEKERIYRFWQKIRWRCLYNLFENDYHKY
jgi:hypothetical protein